MNRRLIAPFCCVLLAACVKVPEGSSGAPSVELMVGSPKTYPGSSVEVRVVASDDTVSAEELTYEWSSSNEDIVLFDTTETSAIFKVGVAAEANQQVTLTAKVSDPDNNRTEKSISVDIDNEPFLIVDGQTDGSSGSDIKPIYLTGIFSGKQVNLKADDLRSSENYEISVSPDGRFVFYTQLFINAQWQARLFDALTGVNYEVNLDFSNIDNDAIASYWSGDSQYLAIAAPQQNTDLSDQDLLYWINIAQLSDEELEITPDSEELPFDRLLWSDNASVLGEKAYAALFNGSELTILDPSAEEPLIGVTDDEGSAFVALNTESGSWSTNQLFFLATVAVPNGEGVTADVQHLFRWSPDIEMTANLSGTSTTAVTSYISYFATQVAFDQGDRLKLHDGNSASGIDLNESSVVTAGQYEYQWSPDGQRLGVMTSPSNAGNAGNWTLHSWASNSKANTSISWESRIDDSNISDWQWNQNRSSITVLSHGENGQDTIFLVDAEVDDGEEQVVGGIFTSEADEANGSMEKLESTLVRSPTGDWQLYWGFDRANSSTHMDIWALNTETKAWKNLSRLMTEYQVPSSAGVFESGEGFDIATPVYAGKTLYWVSGSELVFSVNSADGTDDYLDLRYVDLNSESAPKSILLERESLTEIERLLFPSDKMN